MHTDEYEISLLREQNVCKKKINALQKNLSRLEKQFDMKTEVFVTRFNNGEIGNNGDFIIWMNAYQALNRWQNNLRQYNELISQMKI